MLRSYCISTATAIIAACLFAAGPVAVDDTPTRAPITTTDLLRIRTVSSIDVAADGSRAVFAVRSIAEIPPANSDQQPRWENRSHLFLLDLLRAHAQPRQITFGPRNDRDPRLSPDGRVVAFVRGGEDANGNEKSQVWVMPIDGG
jgi:dipeptidyl aminopeptidase/acylaminoacyl peptidase